MSIWSLISDAVTALVARGESLSTLFEDRQTSPERSVAFTIAVISLGAKMAKADGQVKASEVAAFRQVFQIATRDEAAAARVFNLARQDVAGFDTYAQRIANMFSDQPRALEDILEGLFHIAMADGHYHHGEEEFLRSVAGIFKIPDAVFDCIEMRHKSGEASNPWQILGVPRTADITAIAAKWRQLVKENHPDVMIARGLPAETINLANARLAAINRAWEEIRMRMSKPPEIQRAGLSSE